MRFEELNAQTLSQIGTPEATAKAKELVQGHHVLYGYRLSDRLRGVVWDDHQSIQVEVRTQNDQISYVCSCPQVEGGEICSHVLGLLWAWVEEPGKFLNRAELTEKLKKYSKKELLEIILDLADRAPEVREILKEEEEGLEDILESIDHVVEEVAGDSTSLTDAENRLRRALARADRMAQSGQLAEARSIYFYILDNILGLEERFQEGQGFSPDLKSELFEEYCQFIHEDRHLEKELVQQEIEQLEGRSPAVREGLDLTELKGEVFGAA